MIYRKLGNTGIKVSQLGFGAMRLPMCGEKDHKLVDRDLAIPMIHRAFEGGVNYIDTAIFYCNEDSQRAVGEALKGWRDKVTLSTKNHYYGPDEGAWWQNLENSLQRLDVDSIDIYNHHGVTWQSYVEHIEPVLGKLMRKAKDQGLIKHICCSFHDTNEALVKLIDTGYPEVITLQYNLLDRSLEEGIAYAASKGVGVVVMGPVGGGRLGGQDNILADMVPPGVERVPELALRFVLSNPNVSTAISGMSTMQQVEENLAVAGDEISLSEADRAKIEKQLVRLKKMADLYCTGCGYCKPCPQNINIPQIFDLYNNLRVYGFEEHAKNTYKWIRDNSPKFGCGADECVGCGLCEQKCPQKISIRIQLQEAHQILVRNVPAEKKTG